MTRASPRPPRARGERPTLGDEIADRVSDKVAEKVAAKVDQVAEKVARKLDEATAKHDEKLAAHRERLMRQQARLDERDDRHLHSLERLAAHLDALEVWTRSAGQGRRPRFSRDDIAAAAVAIADAEGFDALSMRRLATELGAGTMTLYHYVTTKDELLTLVNDSIMGEVVVPDDQPLPHAWRDAISIIATRSKDCLQRHPWMLDITDDPPIGPNAIRHFDQTMQAVSELDLPLPELLDIVTMVDEYVFGYCLHERNNLHPDDPGHGIINDSMASYMEGLLHTGDYPTLQRLVADVGLQEILGTIDAHARDTDRFARNLARLLDGIEAALPPGAKRSSTG